MTPYGESKVNVERSVMPLADETFSPMFLRASTAYGMSPRIRFDLVVNNLVAWAYTTGEVHLKSDGSPWRPIVHVEDISARLHRRARGPARDGASPPPSTSARRPRTTRSARSPRSSASVVPGCEVAFAADAAPDKRCYRVDCNLIARTLHGFKPQWTARRGIEQLYEAYQRVGLKLEDFEGERFKRIAHVKKLVGNGEIGTDLRRRSKLSNVG